MVFVLFSQTRLSIFLHFPALLLCDFVNQPSNLFKVVCNCTKPIAIMWCNTMDTARPVLFSLFLMDALKCLRQKSWHSLRFTVNEWHCESDIREPLRQARMNALNIFKQFIEYTTVFADVTRRAYRILICQICRDCLYQKVFIKILPQYMFASWCTLHSLFIKLACLE